MVPSLLSVTTTVTTLPLVASASLSTPSNEPLSVMIYLYVPGCVTVIFPVASPPKLMSPPFAPGFLTVFVSGRGEDTSSEGSSAIVNVYPSVISGPVRPSGTSRVFLTGMTISKLLA